MKTNTFDEKLNTILARLYLDGIADGGTGGALDESCKEARASIKALVLESLPSEIVPTLDDYDMFGDLDHTVRIQHAVIDQVRSIITKGE